MDLYRIKTIARRMVPGAFAAAKYFKYWLHVNRDLWGVFERECSVCGFKGRFRAHAFPPLYDTYCTHCESIERHRLVALADRECSFFASRKVLHFAPEIEMRRYILKQAPSRYLTADLFAHDVDLKIDIEKMALPDADFDTVLCSHVLEHVDDAAALREICRILKPGGRALLMFPICEGWANTYENDAIRDPEIRELHFGLSSHVRYYGRDVRDRIRAAGFELDEYTAVEPFVSRYALTRGEKIFMAHKPLATS